MLIGAAEVPENPFGVSDRGTRKPVVGRGKLTKKDLNIIKQNFPQSQSMSDNPSVESPVEVVVSGEDGGFCNLLCVEKKIHSLET